MPVEKSLFFIVMRKKSILCVLLVLIRIKYGMTIPSAPTNNERLGDKLSRNAVSQEIM